jgi:hypothetical protein
MLNVQPTNSILAACALIANLVAIGCNVIEGIGSRVHFEKDWVIAAFHRPHPAKEAKPYQVRDAGHFLDILGVRP